MDCYKTLLDNLCDFRNTYINKEAKWIDQCSPSASTNAVRFVNWEMTSTQASRAIIGGFTKDGNGCWQFAEWTKWAPILAPYMMNLIKENIPTDLVPQDQD